MGALQNRTAWMTLVVGAIGLLMACAPAGPVQRGQSGSEPAPSAAVPKTLRMGSIREPVEGIALFGGSGDANAQYGPILHAGLTTYDEHGVIVPVLSQKVPTIEDGDWKLLPDGTMEVTWRLRPNVRWHDGMALDAGDFVLGIQIARDPELPLPRSGGIELVTDASAIDASTLVLRWSQPYYGANVGDMARFPAVPRHILGDLYSQGDRQALVNSPYWAREFVGLGPYRLSDWVQGSHMELRANDEFFLGRPEIDRLIVKFFRDAAPMVAALLAGDYDLLAPGSLKINDLAQVTDVFTSQGGKMLMTLGDVGWARLQFRDPDAPWVRDIRVRQALQHILDRQALADTFSPDGGPADIFAPKGDPVYQLAEQRGFPKYPYDITRAQALLRDAGWTLGPDGLVHNAAGQSLNFEVRVVSRTEEGLALADQWKRGGINAEMYAIGKALSSRNDLKAANKGVFWMADTAVPDTFQFFRTTQIASDANGWAGRNLGGYSNPDYDRQYDQLVTELNATRFVSQYADFVRWTARELPFIVAYYEVSSNLVAFKGPIHGPTAPAAVSRVGTWNIRDWEMD